MMTARTKCGSRYRATTFDRRARRFVGSLTDAALGDHLGADAGYAMASRSRYQEIRLLGWNEHLLHAAVFNRRRHLMKVA